MILLPFSYFSLIFFKLNRQYHEGVRAMWFAEKGGTVYKHPYDLGTYENLTTVISINLVHSLPYSVFSLIFIVVAHIFICCHLNYLRYWVQVSSAGYAHFQDT